LLRKSYEIREIRSFNNEAKRKLHTDPIISTTKLVAELGDDSLALELLRTGGSLGEPRDTNSPKEDLKLFLKLNDNESNFPELATIKNDAGYKSLQLDISYEKLLQLENNLVERQSALN
jgi:hypothetical protein